MRNGEYRQGAMAITLRDITEDNFRVAVNLKVAPTQESFVAPNAYSIAQSRFHLDWLNFGLFDDQTMVGYSLCRFDSEAGIWWIVRFMIGAQYQGKGFGGLALQALIDLFSAKPDCKEIRLSIEPENDIARHLYTRKGFQATGEFRGREAVMRYVVVR